MDGNRLAAAGFYFTNQSDEVRSTFCGVEVGHWKEGDSAFKKHQHCSPFCGFAKGLCVGNIPILSNDSPEKSSGQPTGSGNVSSSLFELRPNLLPERSKYYYLYVFFCYVSVFDSSVLIFNVILQLEVLELLNT